MNNAGFHGNFIGRLCPAGRPTSRGAVTSRLVTGLGVMGLDGGGEASGCGGDGLAEERLPQEKDASEEE